MVSSINSIIPVIIQDNQYYVNGSWGKSINASAYNLLPAAQQQINSDFDCKIISTDLFSVINGLCVNSQQSFDVFWSSYGLITYWSVLSLPIIVFLANRFWKNGIERGDSNVDVQPSGSDKKNIYLENYYLRNIKTF
jgi:hypothetical protein